MKIKLTEQQKVLLKRICGPGSRRNPASTIWDGHEKRTAGALVDKGLARFEPDALSYAGQSLHPTAEGREWLKP